jgi:hypothetical protein
VIPDADVRQYPYERYGLDLTEKERAAILAVLGVKKSPPADVGEVASNTVRKTGAFRLLSVQCPGGDAVGTSRLRDDHRFVVVEHVPHGGATLDRSGVLAATLRTGCDVDAKPAVRGGVGVTGQEGPVFLAPVGRAHVEVLYRTPRNVLQSRTGNRPRLGGSDHSAGWADTHPDIAVSVCCCRTDESRH